MRTQQSPCTSRVTVSVCVLALAGAALAFVRPAAAGTYYDYAADSRAVRMWMPDGLKTVKGVLLFGNGASSDNRALANAPRNQAFAEMHEFVVIATAWFTNLPVGEIPIWEEHLQALADQSGHPELVHAPWVALGFSNGGQMDWSWNAVYPEKTLAYVVNKGAYYNFLQQSPESRGNPGILVAGETDSSTRRANIRALYGYNRPDGSLMCWVEEESTGHAWGDTMDLFLPFAAEAIRLRYPADQVPATDAGVELLPLDEADGWLVDQTTYKTGETYIAAWSEYVGDDYDAGYVMNEALACLYRAFATYDKPVSLTCSVTPDARYDVSRDVTLTVNTSAFQNWTSVQILDGAEPVAEQLSDGSPQSSAAFPLTLAPGVHGLSAVVTHLDGRIAVTKIDTFVVVPAPNPVHAGYGQRIYLPQMWAELDGRIAGEEGPSAPAGWTAQWSKVSGPGEVEFDDASLLDTTARFVQAGTYVLRLTGSQLATDFHADVTVNITDPPPPEGSYLDYEMADLGGGLYAWTFRVFSNDGLALPYTLAMGFRGAGGATIRQVAYNGVAPIHTEALANVFDAQGSPPYSKTGDTWVFSPFGDNPVAGMNPLTGTPLTGFYEAANAFAFSCFSGPGSEMGDGEAVAHVVADGNVEWTGTITRDGVEYAASGLTEIQAPEPLAGDYNGDDAVSGADYVLWANTFGFDGSPGKEDLRTDGNGDGLVSGADYVIWANHFGQSR